MSARKDLQHKIRIKYGCPPNTPTDQQLDQIISAALALGERINEADWKHIVYAVVPGAGDWGYHSEDFSDLTALLRRL